MKLELLLRLGNDQLNRRSVPVIRDELPELAVTLGHLHQIILDYRTVYGSGRAVSAPQIGIAKRIVCWNVEGPVTMINPLLSEFSEEMMELWDDCMSFPGLYVKVKRHLRCTLRFLDEQWEMHEWRLEGDGSALIQHEVDHLDGILATQRAVDDRSFRI